MLLMCDEDQCSIFELKGSAFIGIHWGQPVRGLVLKSESELFFDMESELIRSFYELDTLIVMPAVFEITLIAIGE